MEPKFVIFLDVARKCRFRLVASSGEPIAASESYNEHTYGQDPFPPKG